jgi:hypothetical protein
MYYYTLTLIYVIPLNYGVKFHTRTEQMVSLP